MSKHDTKKNFEDQENSTNEKDLIIPHLTHKYDDNATEIFNVNDFQKLKIDAPQLSYKVYSDGENSTKFIIKQADENHIKENSEHLKSVSYDGNAICGGSAFQRSPETGLEKVLKFNEEDLKKGPSTIYVPFHIDEIKIHTKKGDVVSFSIYGRFKYEFGVRFERNYKVPSESGVLLFEQCPTSKFPLFFHPFTDGEEEYGLENFPIFKLPVFHEKKDKVLSVLKSKADHGEISGYQFITKVDERKFLLTIYNHRNEEEIPYSIFVDSSEGKTVYKINKDGKNVACVTVAEFVSAVTEIVKSYTPISYIEADEAA